jgi:hypothetical protein
MKKKELDIKIDYGFLKLKKDIQKSEKKRFITYINKMVEMVKEERELYGEREIVPYLNELKRWVEHDSIPVFKNKGDRKYD